MGRKTKLTPQVQKEIVAYIRSGAFDWVAAQASGITPQTFCNWMRWGEKGNPTYVSFFEDVRQARAQARVAAETEVRKTDPFKWLRYGPGRDRPGEPGWTDSQAVQVTGKDGGPIETKDVTELTDDERIKRLLALLDQGEAKGTG